jgi:hypothetical protein
VAVVVKIIGESVQQAGILECQVQRRAKLPFDPLRFADAIEDGDQIAARVFGVASTVRRAMQQMGGVVGVAERSGRQSAQQIGFDVVAVTRQQRRAMCRHAVEAVGFQVGDRFGQDREAIGCWTDDQVRAPRRLRGAYRVGTKGSLTADQPLSAAVTAASESTHGSADCRQICRFGENAARCVIVPTRKL